MLASTVVLRTSPQRIALIKPSALGDIMHSLPVLTALRKRFPQAHIAWIINRGYAPLIENHPDLDEIIPFDREGIRKAWVRGSWSYIRFLQLLRSQRFDMVIDLQGLLRTGLMSLATAAPVRLGLASAREGSRVGYTHRIDDRTGVHHAVDRYWRVIEALQDAPSIRTFHVPIEPVALAWAQERLGSLPRPWLAVGVGSRWLTKRWPPEYFAELAQRAQQHFGGSAVFVGAPEEAHLAQHAASLVRGPVNQLTGKTSLSQLVAVLAKVDAMIANDTGPLHLAVALGRPVVAPYTCTLAARTGPYGQADRAVETSVWCRGSYLKTCARMECMAELTPARLWPSLEAILRLWQQRRHAA